MLWLPFGSCFTDRHSDIERPTGVWRLQLRAGMSGTMAGIDCEPKLLHLHHLHLKGPGVSGARHCFRVLAGIAAARLAGLDRIAPPRSG